MLLINQIVVVDSSQQQSLILDQSQITYQLPQYTTIDGAIEFAQREQQVFFMDGSNNQSLQEVVVDQPLQQVIQQAITPQTVQAVVQASTIQHPQPVILNHQLSDSRSTPRLPVQVSCVK